MAKFRLRPSTTLELMESTRIAANELRLIAAICNKRALSRALPRFDFVERIDGGPQIRVHL